MKVNHRLMEKINRLVFSLDSDWNEEEHKRDKSGKFAKTKSSQSAMKSVKANIARGQKRMNVAILNQSDVKRGMYNTEFGWVDFVWGDNGITKPKSKKGEIIGKGISHIIEARMRKDNLTYPQAVRMLTYNIVETIAKGTAVVHKQSRLVLDYKANSEQNGHRVILTKQKGGNAWILSGYEKFPVVKANDNGELKMGNDKFEPTQYTATRSRDILGAISIPTTGVFDPRKIVLYKKLAVHEKRQKVRISTQQIRKIDNLLSAIAMDNKWITVKPNGHDKKGKPVEIDGLSFIDRIDILYRSLMNERKDNRSR